MSEKNHFSSSTTVRLLAVVVCIVVVAAGCGGGKTDGAAGPTGTSPTGTSPAPTPGGILKVGLHLETSDYKPPVAQWFSSGYLVAASFYERLAAYDERGAARPYLAASIEPNADFTQWTIGLRPGVTFHDGTPFNAAAVKANLDASKASLIGSQLLAPVDSITVVDNLTVRVQMNMPWSTFPHSLTFQPGYMAALATLADPEGGQHPIGTGPFVFKEWQRGSRLVVTKNTQYWRQGLPLLEGIEYRILGEPSSRSASLLSGDVDLIEARDAATLIDFDSRAASGEPYRVYVNTKSETTEQVVFFNTAKPPFDNATARQAVAAAIDTKTISDTQYSGRFSPADGPFKPGSPWYRDAGFQVHDPALAKRLADDYQRTSGKQLAFTLLATPDSDTTALAQLIQGMVSEAGIKMDVELVDAVAAIGRGLLGNYEAGMIDQLWGSQHPDREYVLLLGANALPVGKLALDFTRYASDDVDAGLNQARRSGDPAVQAAGWEKVQRALAKNYVWTFIVHDEVGDVAKTDVRDVDTWTFPDKTRGLGQEGTLVSLSQIWLERPQK